MPRWLQALSLALALAALSLLTACSSSGQASVRFVHAIQDAGALDIDVYGTNDSAGAVEFNDISFLGVQPTQPGYTTLDSGSDAIEGFLDGHDNRRLHPNERQLEWRNRLHRSGDGIF